MSTGDDDKGPSNPFIRWKQHVDSSIGFTLNGLLGIPTMVSQSFAMRRPDGESHQRDGNCTRGRDSASSETPGDATSSGLSSQLLEFKNFLYNSEYSPVHLHHLPPPVPRDIPMGVDPNGFTFSDAFEDLLVASSGSPLMDLRSKYYISRDRRLFQWDDNPDLAWNWWMRRLNYGKQSGLLDGYFPRPETRSSLSSMSDDRQRTIETEWDRAVARASGQPEAIAKEGRPRETRSLFQELEMLAKVMEDIMEGDQTQDEGDSATGSNAKEANTEQDIYSAFLSGFNQTEKSLSNFIKLITDGTFSSKVNASVSTTSTTETSDSVSESGRDEMRTVRTTEEHVDAFGNWHAKTVVKRMNANGDEVARETQYSFQSATQHRWGSGRADEVDEDEDEPRQETPEHEPPSQSRQEQKKPSGGWFWK